MLSGQSTLDGKRGNSEIAQESLWTAALVVTPTTVVDKKFNALLSNKLKNPN